MMETEGGITSTSTTYGRTVRLHFACRAPLPIGSSLRVTSSQLWAPGTLTPGDPTDAKTVSVKASEVALPDNTTDNALDIADLSHGVKESYASSVEMVTSPDEWPMWRTRTPVVIALRHHHGKVEHHRYRYMVVTPGAKQSDLMDPDGEIMQDNDETMTVEGRSGMGATTSQNGSNVGTQIMAWEDPFRSNADNQSTNDLRRHRSATSLPSVRRQTLSKTLINLPYRTLEIDTLTATIKHGHGHSAHVVMNEDEEQEFTPDGIQIDTWDNANDYTYCAYVLRNELNKQNKAKKALLSRFNSTGTVASDTEVDPENIRMDTKVSFSNMIDVVNVPSNDDGDDGAIEDSAVTSLTMTPKRSASVPDQANSKSKNPRIFFVCFHLPVILTKHPHTNQWKACWSESLLAATEGSDIVRNYDAHWVGTVSCDVTTDEEKEAVRIVLEEMDCTPLFFDEKVKDDHYFGMCKQVLWPAFHNIDLLDLGASGCIPDVNDAKNGDGRITMSHHNGAYRSVCGSDWDQSRLDGWWQAYRQVNNTFAETLFSMLKPGDIMWVHDYHLTLLPKLVDDMEYSEYSGRSVTKKVFLLHIPFPTSQVFRELECGESILEGILHSDVVGFHAFDHARHFLKAAKRILGLNYESLIGGLIGVQLGRRTVLVTMHNVSVEPKMVNAMLDMPSVAEGTAILRQKHTSRRVISGIDIAQQLSGISLKLLAFERLLKDYPIWLDKVVMVQRCLIPGSRLEDESKTLREVRYIVKRIKDRFGPHVIDCEEIVGSSLPIDQRLALWKVSDVLMVTPIREGLNLLPMEYVFTKKRPASPGVVISSEFSAVCSVLNGALRVNPFDIQMTVTSIDKALTMEDGEKEGRRIRDEGFVSSCTSSQWTKSILMDLNDATAVASDSISDNDSDDTSIMGTKYEKKDLITSTALFLQQEHEISFAHLDMSSVTKSYEVSKKRVIFLDLNGTIVIKEPPGKYLKREILGSSGLGPQTGVVDALRALCSNPNNTVFVVSGDSQENVEKAVGHIEGLGLAASNGACFAPPSKYGEERNWKYFDLGVDWEAVKRIVMPILAKYTARSNGSFVKLTHSSIGWSYYSCDPEWGSLQASHLVLEMEQALRAFDVRFVMIKGIVEVVPRRLDKGLIVKNVLREVELRGEDDVDFILCIGDDVQDEKMFTSVFSFLAELEDPNHVQSSPPVVDESGTLIPSTASMSDRSYHDLSASFGDSMLRHNRPMYAFTTTVGKKDSHALTYVDSARDVATLLMTLGRDDNTDSEDQIGITS